MEDHGFFVLLVLLSSACIVFVGGQSTNGFISIDCGKPKDYNHVDTTTGITYISDFQFVKTGELHKVAPEYLNSVGWKEANDLRSFPNGTRNCYNIESVKPGSQYLVRAFFMYGNYDGLSKHPEFDLYLGVNLWAPMTKYNASDYYMSEMITIANSSKISVCLVNTGSGTPFISALELRPLPSPNTLYPNYTTTSQSLRFLYRGDVGGTTMLRYPADYHDRLWLPFLPPAQGSVRLVSPSPLLEPITYFDMPPEVMKTAVTVAAGAGPCLNFTVPLTPDPARQVRRFYIALGFVEVQPPAGNQTLTPRAVDVFLNDHIRYQNITFGPALDDWLVQYDLQPQTLDKLYFSFCEATGSLLPPLLNAFDIQEVIDMMEFETYTTDVDAITDIQIHYKIQKNWNGDPCSPKFLIWDGLDCDYDFTNPRIIALNLSLSGLNGEISISFATLTQLQRLNLSGNNLTGSIPDFLGSLLHLTYLNLEGNGFTGPIPRSLSDRSSDGLLIISVKGNPYFDKNDPGLCQNPKGCRPGNNKIKNLLIAILVPVGSILLILTLLLIAMNIRRRRKRDPTSILPQNGRPTGKGNQQKNVDLPEIPRQTSNPMTPLNLESKQFSYEELVSITKNFSAKIGAGGSGFVYHGVLKDGMAVAVKVISQSSSQCFQAFQTEAQLLTRIHHKNLVPLVGYCNDIKCLALVYEYMPEGSLEDHFSGKAGNISALCWKDRVNIAIDAAQGLEYLHKGCRPAIIHRDVKSSNILLTKNMEARISDFGLSKVFPDEHYTHVSTRIMGTLGYLDPEYYSSYRLTEKSDVYGFGVVLLEMITGLPAIAKRPEKVHLVQLVKEELLDSGDVSYVVDERLQRGYSVPSLKIAVQTALACTRSVSGDRPMMGEVLVRLKECLDLETGQAASSAELDLGNSRGTSAEIVPLRLMEHPSAR